MREMKDSGVEWIGKIPKDWTVVKLKNIKDDIPYAIVDGPFGTAISTNDYVDEGVPLIRIININQPGMTEDNLIFITEEHAESIRRSSIHKGDIVFAKTGATVGKCAINDKFDYGIMSSSCVKISISSDCDNRYYYYFFYTDQFQNELRNACAGTTRDTINLQPFSNLRTVLPLPKEQHKIADYLDSKCSKIDEIIAKQEKIIEKLKEYKLSVITEAVTKGLDPDVEMKESGVDWLGLFPSHWDYCAFKNVLTERNEKNDPVKTRERLSLSIDLGVTLYADKTTNLDRFKDDVSQYKIAHEGDLVLNSMNMIVGAIGISKWFGCVSPAYYTYFDDTENHITAQYCDFLLRCKTMRKVLFSLGKGIMAIDRGDDRINTCRLKVSRQDLRALKIPVPPIDEQLAIVEYLREKEAKIDKTIVDREHAVERLQEYKKSLIYEVVTGKKEV